MALIFRAGTRISKSTWAEDSDYLAWAKDQDAWIQKSISRAPEGTRVRISVVFEVFPADSR